MTVSTEVLVEIVTTLTTTDDQTARAHLDAPGPSPEHHVALENLHNLLRQLPAHHTSPYATGICRARYRRASSMVGCLPCGT